MSNRLWVAKRMPLTQRAAQLLKEELARAGINLPELRRMAVESRRIGEHITEYKRSNGTSLRVLCDGALLNLSTGFGFPIEVIDYSFAAAIALWAHALSVPRVAGLNAFPHSVDARVME
jgi:S-adenosylhomocysteine hydrolase